MKIVHVIIGLNVGGAELMLKRLVLHSHQKGMFEHVVISLTELGVIGPTLREQGVEVYSLGMKSMLFVPSTLLKLRRLLKKIHPDVVQTWMYHADFLGGLAAKSVGVKNIIWGIRTTDVSQGASRFTVYLSKLCAKLSYYIPDTIVCAAHVSKDYHIGIGYDESKMIVIPNGFDLEALKATDEDGWKIRRQNNLSTDDIVIGSVGRFNPVKNQKLFIDVAALLVKEHPNLKFLMVGRYNTTENKELMSWINDYEIADNFRLLGERDDVPKCLKAMDVFCLHSKTEGFPNVLCEAILLEKIVVSTNVGDVKYLISETGTVGLSAFLFSEKVKLIIKNKKYLDKNNLSLRALEFSKEYSMKNCISKFEMLYTQRKVAISC